MIPYAKNVILASADQVAIDAVAARMMGMDPLSIKYIRLAHDRGLGCGDPRGIRIAGDTDAAEENWQFAGPFRRMTFASRMQHKIYWGPLKRPVEWSLKTFLAPWSYLASVSLPRHLLVSVSRREANAGRSGKRLGPSLQELGVPCPHARRI